MQFKLHFFSQIFDWAKPPISEALPKKNPLCNNKHCTSAHIPVAWTALVYWHQLVWAGWGWWRVAGGYWWQWPWPCPPCAAPRSSAARPPPTGSWLSSPASSAAAAGSAEWKLQSLVLTVSRQVNSSEKGKGKRFVELFNPGSRDINCKEVTRFVSVHWIGLCAPEERWAHRNTNLLLFNKQDRGTIPSGYHGHLGYASPPGIPDMYLTTQAHIAFLDCRPYTLKVTVEQQGRFQNSSTETTVFQWLLKLVVL